MQPPTEPSAAPKRTSLLADCIDRGSALGSVGVMNQRAKRQHGSCGAEETGYAQDLRPSFYWLTPTPFHPDRTW